MIFELLFSSYTVCISICLILLYFCYILYTVFVLNREVTSALLYFIGTLSITEGILMVMRGFSMISDAAFLIGAVITFVPMYLMYYWFRRSHAIHLLETYTQTSFATFRQFTRQEQIDFLLTAQVEEWCEHKKVIRKLLRHGKHDLYLFSPILHRKHWKPTVSKMIESDEKDEA